MIVTVTDRKVEDIGKKVSITGQVLDTTTPVPDALVLLTNGPLASDLSNIVRSAITDLAGVYNFTNLLPKSYSLAIFRNRTSAPEIFDNFFSNLDSEYVMPELDTGISITTPLVTTPIIDNGKITGFNIENSGAGYSMHVPPIITYPGGFAAKGVVDPISGSVISYIPISTGDATGVELTDNCTVALNESAFSDSTLGNIIANTNPGTGDQGALLSETMNNIVSDIQQNTRVLSEKLSLLTLGRQFDAKAITGIPGTGGTFGVGYYNAALQCLESETSSPINPGDMSLNWGVRINAYKSGTITVYEGNESALNFLKNVDYFEVAAGTSGGVIGQPTGNYVTYDIYKIEATTHPASLLRPSEEYPGRTVPNLDLTAISYFPWLEQVFAPFVGKKFGSYAAYASAKSQVTTAIKQYAFPGVSFLQSGNEPALGSQINSFLSGLYNDWQALIVEWSTQNSNFLTEQQIYQAVKAEGLQLVKDKIITEEQYNIGKGFVGRDQFVEPFLDGILEIPGSAWLLKAPLSIIGIFLWQAADAIADGNIKDAFFDFYTQSYGAIKPSPPDWIIGRTFNVSGINKAYVNGQWITVSQ